MLVHYADAMPLHLASDAYIRSSAAPASCLQEQRPQKVERTPESTTVNPRRRYVGGADMDILEIELPGVEKSNVDLNVGDYCLRLSAERAMPSGSAASGGDEEKECAAEGAGAADQAQAPQAVLTYAARIPLQTRADVGAVEAEMKNGLLTIRVPHKRPETHRIKLQ